MKSFQKNIESAPQVRKLNLQFDPDLILLFISPSYSDPQSTVDDIKIKFPNSIIAGCSTSGEIMDTSVLDGSIIFNALQFEKTKLRQASIKIDDYENSSSAGAGLAKLMDGKDLKHIFVFSDGLHVNGADLVDGMNTVYDTSVAITGGLAGDGPDFKNTFIVNNGRLSEKEVVGIGLYGKYLKVGYGSKGGWGSFGKERVITKSKENVLFEIDGQPALQLYKSFLGEQAEELPGSGLLFPLSLRTNEGELPVVRTILSVDEGTQSLTFAGNIPEGSYARLMKANVDHLIDGAENSAQISKEVYEGDAEFALLISCVGRRLVLDQLVEEEIEAVREVLGEKPLISGFYSYGELAPFGKFNPCQLHNQTMTITTLSEV